MPSALVIVLVQVPSLPIHALDRVNQPLPQLPIKLPHLILNLVIIPVVLLASPEHHKINRHPDSTSPIILVSPIQRIRHRQRT